MIFWNTCHLDLESMSFVHSKFETWRVPGSIPMIVGRKNWWMAVDWDLLLSASWSSFLVIVHLSVHLLVRLLHPCPPPFSPPSSPPWPLSCPLHWLWIGISCRLLLGHPEPFLETTSLKFCRRKWRRWTIYQLVSQAGTKWAPIGSSHFFQLQLIRR